ncbi:ATP-binding protein [Kineosporia sp. NBRC 101677]|uniref:sensor histidine kinase n=1 Tax=Kineosporia sp. NBRC 101677 TaxID=3032197 RepID=UPI0025578CCC|nr:ATP-binding protein [Kineosporia sp. NBRC 101677]
MLKSARRDLLLARVAAFRPGPGQAHLTRLCQELSVSLQVEHVQLTLADGQEFGWPDAGPGPSQRRSLQLPLRAGGESVGLLNVSLPTPLGLSVGLGRQRKALLRDLADLLGPVLDNVGLQNEVDESLHEARGHAELVAAARRRAFGERDAERQEIERDLHDGAQHQLVALGMTLGLLELHADNGNEEGIQAQIRRLRTGLDRARRTLLASVEGGSPLLEESGVLPALKSEFREAGPQVRLDAQEWDAERRYEPAIELAVYFICLEGVNNARKHAAGAQVVVRLAAGPSQLVFSVTDDGPGMKRGSLEGSSGLANMHRRIAAAGGWVQIRTAPDAGTAICGFIPL